MMTKKFNIILADPPWSYNDKMRGHSFSLDHEYQTQSLEWIKSIDVKSISSKDCALFLWCCSPLLPEALEVLTSWGFKFKTVVFVWSKYSKNGKLIKNLGKWTMGNVEMVLLGVKGKPKRVCNNVYQLIQAERTKHSAKPPEVRERIVKLMGDLPRIELFAREKVEGWTCLGNGIDGKDIKEAINDLILPHS